MEPTGHRLPKGSAGTLPRARGLQLLVCWHGAGGLSPPAGGRARHRRGPPGPLDATTEGSGSRSPSRLGTFCFPFPKLVTLPAWATRGVTVAPACKSQDSVTLCCPVCPQPPRPTEEWFPSGVCGQSALPPASPPHSPRTRCGQLTRVIQRPLIKARVMCRRSTSQQSQVAPCAGVGSQPESGFPGFLWMRQDLPCARALPVGVVAGGAA